MEFFDKIIEKMTNFFSESIDNGMIYVYGSVALILLVLFTVGFFWFSLQTEPVEIPRNLSIINANAKGYCNSKGFNSYEIINGSRFKCVNNIEINYTIKDLEISS